MAVNYYGILQYRLNKKLDHNRPDLLFLDKKERTCLIVDIACPFDTRTTTKEDEKLNKYQDLEYEIKKLCEQKHVTIIPTTIGALGTVNKKLTEWIKKIDVECPIELLQKAGLLGTARIVRMLLDT